MPETPETVELRTPGQVDPVDVAYPTPPIPTTYPVKVETGDRAADRAQLIEVLSSVDGNDLRGRRAPEIFEHLYGQQADAILAAGYHR